MTEFSVRHSVVSYELNGVDGRLAKAHVQHTEQQCVYGGKALYCDLDVDNVRIVEYFYEYFESV